MAVDSAVVKELLQKLEADREAYLTTLNRAHETLARALSATSGSPFTFPDAFPDPLRRPTQDVESLRKGSTFSGEDESESDDDNESLFVNQTLPPESYEVENLCEHLNHHTWDKYGQTILEHVLRDKHLLDPASLFPTDKGPQVDRSHLCDHVVYDVGIDGAPVEYKTVDTDGLSKALAIWRSLNNINLDPKRRLAAGRITILREPSPLLFSALHFTMSKHFDMDEVFQLLVDDSPTKAYMGRAFATEPRQQRTFVFAFKYFTLIGNECVPKEWQKSDEELKASKTHIPITRCSSVVALSLSNDPIGRVKRRARQGTKKVITSGPTFDPFAPWKVLSLQCYPDWKSTSEDHESTKHYVNGPEAFMITLRAEYRDAQQRLMGIHKRIVSLVTPPDNFMFSEETRDKLLFEDDKYTYSRRYFWAFQTLAIMNDNIQEMIAAYRETFTDDVWTGKHKTIWPGAEDTSARYSHWRRRMENLRKDLEQEVLQLEAILRSNEKEQKEIKALRDQLFSGTSVEESRKSVQQTLITVEQGHNIKILTLVSIFFLPLTFVTSVFGMTNMPPENSFIPFGIVTAIICPPTYMLIGSLNTKKGMKFWREQTIALFHRIGRFFVFFWSFFRPIATKPADTASQSQTDDGDDPKIGRENIHRSESAVAGIARRLGGRIKVETETDNIIISSNGDGRRAENDIKFHPAVFEKPSTPNRRSSRADPLESSVVSLTPTSLPRSKSDSQGLEGRRKSFFRTFSERWERSHQQISEKQDESIC